MINKVIKINQLLSSKKGRNKISKFYDNDIRHNEMITVRMKTNNWPRIKKNEFN